MVKLELTPDEVGEVVAGLVMRLGDLMVDRRDAVGANAAPEFINLLDGKMDVIRKLMFRYLEAPNV